MIDMSTLHDIQRSKAAKSIQKWFIVNQYRKHVLHNADVTRITALKAIQDKYIKDNKESMKSLQKLFCKLQYNKNTVLYVIPEEDERISDKEDETKIENISPNNENEMHQEAFQTQQNFQNNATLLLVAFKKKQCKSVIAIQKWYRTLKYGQRKMSFNTKLITRNKLRKENNLSKF
ncbi:uncharacterized protein LOC111631785 [Centruroides sculpturatus]|uniref:uncharacterized protein LOC111618103 n=1 Tax=Centruroides sculpturatus TaxID=218467 RepID=UPI000C6E60C7|nr:uncharacterized protein LOC111618103 [Centruroides sculpturatus]XP_023215318.1 uncharacterized protein LOC111618103 [Centruroides sculpturatus]XP_023231863.1 uncharacterized protein LOC111631785 [Centruroides sculpturatus]XP_023231864.1 uncharacterized protein LOC111631785 [Centruroides sculpturatus]